MMKNYFSFLILCLFTLTVNAQIDSKNKSASIPAVKSKKDSAGAKVLLPSKPINNNTINGISIPKTNTTLNIPKKEFSMFGEKFGNPGELYEDRLNKKAKELRPEGYNLNSGLREDAYWGDYRTTSNYVHILYRDYSAIDGDLLRILVNDDIIKPSILLTEDFKGFILDLKEGFNKIEFFAINEGDAAPNTAEYRIIDENKNIITGKIWALSKGIKVTVILIKE